MTEFVLPVRFSVVSFAAKGYDMNADVRPVSDAKPCPDNAGTHQCVEWYIPGQARLVDINGMQIVVRFVGRRGRRGRIAITAPPGAAFHASDTSSNALPNVSSDWAADL